MKRTTLLSVALIVIPFFVSGRTWTSIDGKTLDGDMVLLRTEFVRIRKKSETKTIDIPRQQLSKRDNMLLDLIMSSDSKKTNADLEMYQHIMSRLNKGQVYYFTHYQNDESRMWYVIDEVWMKQGLIHKPQSLGDPFDRGERFGKYDRFDPNYSKSNNFFGSKIEPSKDGNSTELYTWNIHYDNSNEEQLIRFLLEDSGFSKVEFQIQ